MKRIFGQKKCIVFLAFFLLQYIEIEAQIRLKTEYLVSSSVKNASDENLAPNKPLQTFDLWMRVPLSMKYNEDNQLNKASFVSLWAIQANLNNSQKIAPHTISQISNISLTFGQFLPIHKKWFALLMLGGGTFSTNISKFSAKDTFVLGGGMLIRRENSTFEWGIGASVNNAYDYAMFSPAFMLRWNIDSEYSLRLFFYNYLDFEFSKQISKNIKLGLVSEVQVLLATADYQSKEVALGSQIGHLGIRPEIKIGKHLAVQPTAGLAFSRNTYFEDKTFQVYYNVLKNNKLSPYLAVGLKYDR